MDYINKWSMNDATATARRIGVQIIPGCWVDLSLAFCLRKRGYCPLPTTMLAKQMIKTWPKENLCRLTDWPRAGAFPINTTLTIDDLLVTVVLHCKCNACNNQTSRIYSDMLYFVHMESVRGDEMQDEDAGQQAVVFRRTSSENPFGLLQQGMNKHFIDVKPLTKDETALCINSRSPWDAVCKHCREPVLAPDEMPAHFITEHLGWWSVHQGIPIMGCRGVDASWLKFFKARAQMEHSLVCLLGGCPECDGVNDPHCDQFNNNTTWTSDFAAKRPRWE